MLLETASPLEEFVYDWFEEKGVRKTFDFPSKSMFPYLERDKYDALILLHKILSQCDNDDEIDTVAL